MSRSIKIKFSYSRYREFRDDGQRIRIELIENVNIPAELFAYRLLPDGPNGDLQAIYSHICSPSDIEEMPANTAQPEAVPPWFRLNYVDMLFRSTSEVAEFRRLVIEDVTRIVDTLERMTTLLPSDSVVISRP
jgi:hypothetical protein